jgi:hypothetical protein
LVVVLAKWALPLVVPKDLCQVAKGVLDRQAQKRCFVLVPNGMIRGFNLFRHEGWEEAAGNCCSFVMGESIQEDVMVETKSFHVGCPVSSDQVSLLVCQYGSLVKDGGLRCIIEKIQE